jgi:hypothetical protein
VTLQTFAAHRNDVPIHSSVVISEFVEEDTQVISEAHTSDHTITSFGNTDLISAPPEIETQTEENVSESLAEDTHMATVEQGSVSITETSMMASSSDSSGAQAAAPVRARGRPKKTATPLVQTQVRRSPRLNKDGTHHELPVSTCRRSSSVPRAIPPAVLQVAEMQRIGVEECFIEPSELTEDRLLQTRPTEE